MDKDNEVEEIVNEDIDIYCENEEFCQGVSCPNWLECHN